ncbi:uncharacterized protein [Lepeophtheirus salmonis]|uniref:uncharacterized protein isoform X1 n=1 Tax=Lepeophtheirus salmonis TaxID=72036 RepID=UPI001AE93CA4|nr:uncharacterized protein LOC121120457 isoform X1 [Lepeophtheirus salmonis]XP_040571263.1 uncharacterized protein LOC121120457 isoform X1 [Lepeophtheirus salmonis]XP_040571264.1 uncharacterized protein LOC121120457 isoform X1 [Lepeophtheirus salmonis]XP_040571265.1 uncharacterized protein LOC121120457 isoform X1 [Lepeophtheirus salmonis]XP_040571266.1 uncharacterized protein LOC121120457 isoform X1 [Lepeophtheirus salmonis]XP_040571267.1 uncharacterized protein LOC121120457 isoform X1 [Lepeop
MGKNRNCIVPGCDTGRFSSRGVKKEHPISLHGFPNESTWIETWKEVIPIDWNSSMLYSIVIESHSININNAVICSRHFKKTDFRSDIYSDIQPSKKRRLNRDAIPSIFPGDSPSPENITVIEEPIQYTIESTEKQDVSDCIDLDNAVLCIEVEELKDLNHLESEICSSTLPSKVLYQRDLHSIDFFYVEKFDGGPPRLGFSLIVYNDLHFKAYVRGKEVLFSNLRQLRVSKVFKTYFEILYALNALKKCL